MSNTYFRFKQFIVEQDKCAMKVCTDACILGATSDADEATHLLDIGTGTGLLSLMMAQRFPQLKIDAVEIDPDAAKQANENFDNSPWKKRLTIIQKDINQYVFSLEKKYDYIICNPPFYDNHLKPENKALSLARHAGELDLEELSIIIQHSLSYHGKFSVLLPPDGMRQLELFLLSKKIFLNNQLFIKDRKELPVIRVIGEFSFIPSSIATYNFAIKKDDMNYTDSFKRVLKDFYLAF